MILSAESPVSTSRTNPLIIMDMDGVITSEERYWEAGASAVYEILFSEEYLNFDSPFPPEKAQDILLSKVVSKQFIGKVKDSGINNNWDLAFLAVALFLSHLAPESSLGEVCGENSSPEAFQRLKKHISHSFLPEDIDSIANPFFARYSDKRGFELVEKLNEGNSGKPLFLRKNSLWNLVQNLFQEWYWGTETKYKYKPGLVKKEEPIVPLTDIERSLSELKQKGFSFGIATGRPYKEIVPLLKKWNLFYFFDAKRVCTFDTIFQGEKIILRDTGEKINLSKPSPYIFLKAAFPHLSPLEIQCMKKSSFFSDNIIIVGDAAGDLMAAEKMGIPAVLVSTGVGGKKGVEKLKKYNPFLVLNSITDLPVIAAQYTVR